MTEEKVYCVYILASRSRRLYIGVTGNVLQRLWIHRTHARAGHASRYCVTHLVYIEILADIHSAIAREKQLKRWSRAKKVRLIEKENPEWTDLAESWFDEPPKGRSHGE